LLQAKESYGVKLQPIAVTTKDLPHCEPLLTGLLTCFDCSSLGQELQQADRPKPDALRQALDLDPDSTVLQCLDYLFLLPSASILMPAPHSGLPVEPANQFLVGRNSHELDLVLREIEAADEYQGYPD
jgi:hypothetical protein